MKHKLFPLIIVLFLIPTIANAYAGITQDSRSENEVIIPLGAYSPLCEKNDECYIPSNLIISQNEKVTWINSDFGPHTVTSGNTWSGADKLFSSKILEHNDVFEFSFIGFLPGTYDYYCVIHPWMKGSITISGDLNNFQKTL